MAKFKEKILAHKLRRNGMSIGGIAKELSVSKGTVSLWCREIILTTHQQKILHDNVQRLGARGRIMGAQMNKQKRIDALVHAEKEARKLIGNMKKRELLFLSLGLYWGEGSKNTDNRFIIVNSDALILKTIIKWLTEEMKIPRDTLTPQIYINESHKDRTAQVTKYWERQLLLEEKQFRKPVFIHVPHKKVYINRNTYMGVLHLYVQKSSRLKYLTMSMIEMVKKQI